MSFERIMHYFNASNTMEMLLALLIMIVVIVMIRMTLNPSDRFTLRDLISTEEKIDSNKFTRFGAWVVSTWGFVYLLVSKPENFPEWYFAVYMGAWVANTIMDKYMNNNKGALSKPPISGPTEWPHQER